MSYTLFESALRYAIQFHKDDLKNKTPTPYIFHPLAVSSYVLEFGGDFIQAAAGALHDTIDEEKKAVFLDMFGAEVTDLSFAFLDPAGFEMASWQEKKQAYLGKIRQLEPRALLVIACEELHDSRSLNREIRTFGLEVWARYPVSSDQVIWYYQELLKIFRLKLGINPIIDEFVQAVADLKNHL